MDYGPIKIMNMKIADTLFHSPNNCAIPRLSISSIFFFLSQWLNSKGTFIVLIQNHSVTLGRLIAPLLIPMDLLGCANVF